MTVRLWQKHQAEKGSESDGKWWELHFQMGAQKGPLCSDGLMQRIGGRAGGSHTERRAKALNLHLMPPPSIFRPALQMYVYVLHLNRTMLRHARLSDFPNIWLVPDGPRVTLSSSNSRNSAVNLGLSVYLKVIYSIAVSLHWAGKRLWGARAKRAGPWVSATGHFIAPSVCLVVPTHFACSSWFGGYFLKSLSGF